ncbi:MAG: VCBS repeat-containing protein [Chloroflexota bacterium]
MNLRKIHYRSLLNVGLLLLLTTTISFNPVSASGPNGNDIHFEDIVAEGGSGIDYERVTSDRDAIFDGFKQQGIVPITDAANFPHKARGIPGVAIFDFDDDHDLDIYVTNGPGAANSLYSNQLKESGNLTFVDVANSAGVGVQAKDSNGVCFGDLDNDGDHDLLVLNNEAAHNLFENQGNGTFSDVSAQSDIVHLSGAVGCSMGDVNGDGLIDVVIGNAFNQDSFLPIFVVPFDLNSPDQLYLNDGDLTFTDVSDTSGIRDLDGIPAGKAAITWAVSMVDFDMDGDTDITFAHDQAGFPAVKYDPVNGIDRGFVHFMQNDGTGHFTDISEEVGTVGGVTDFGAWMGFAFADLDCNEHLDTFVTNFGDGSTNFFGQFDVTDWASEWFLQDGNGNFTGGDYGDLVTTPFGWGTSALDYDNDGDSDIVFHGGIDAGTVIDATNAGVLLENDDCSATFTYERDVFESNHSRRNVQGSAVGDLNNDGFVDIVSVSNFDIPDSIPLTPVPVTFNSPFDQDNFVVPTWAPINNGTELQWLGLVFPNGSLSVEINSADNRNRWVAVEVMGTVDLTTDGQVNRDGLGAVVSFTPRNGTTAINPIVGGSSHASQDSLIANFGLGRKNRGVVDVLWPGGTKNRLYNVKRGEHILFPEIPCSYDGDWENRREYRDCVDEALGELVDEDVLTRKEAKRFRSSALRAFRNQ